MVHYKLSYFDVRGLAEMSRCILHFAGVEFEDNRVTYEQWPSLKSSTPYGQVPVLEIDGVKLAQSFAIARFLARKHDVAGKDELEIAVVDSYGELLKDLLIKTTPYLLVLSGRREGDKAKLYKEFAEAIDQIFPRVEKIISASGTGFLSKSGVTWVDFFLASYFLTLKKHTADDVEKFTGIEAHGKKVHEIPQLKNYFANRKDTPF